MKEISKKRIAAYIFDFVLLITVSSLLLGLIPRSDEYKRNIKEQEKLLTESLDSKFDDDNKALKEYSTLRYKTEKETIHITLLSCVFSIAYFGTFAFFNNGETLGKKLMKIKVESDGDNSHFWFILRAFILNGSLTSIFLVLSLFWVKPEEYFNVTILICLLHSIFIIASTITMFKREDGKGLHDLLCRTSVINE